MEDTEVSGCEPCGPKAQLRFIYILLFIYMDIFLSLMLLSDTQELRESVQLLLTAKIAVYLMTFLIVTVAWAAHIR